MQRSIISHTELTEAFTVKHLNIYLYNIQALSSKKRCICGVSCGLSNQIASLLEATQRSPIRSLILFTAWPHNGVRKLGIGNIHLDRIKRSPLKTVVKPYFLQETYVRRYGGVFPSNSKDLEKIEPASIQVINQNCRIPIQPYYKHFSIPWLTWIFRWTQLICVTTYFMILITKSFFQTVYTYRVGIGALYSLLKSFT